MFKSELMHEGNGVGVRWLPRRLWGLSLWNLHQEMEALGPEVTLDLGMIGRAGAAL